MAKKKYTPPEVTARERKISNPKQLDRSVFYRSYSGIPWQVAAKEFEERFHRMPEEVLTYSNICYIELTTDEADGRKPR